MLPLLMCDAVWARRRRESGAFTQQGWEGMVVVVGTRWTIAFVCLWPGDCVAGEVREITGWGFSLLLSLGFV